MKAKLFYTIILITLFTSLSSSFKAQTITWQQVPFPSDEVLSIAFVNDTLYAATRLNGVYVSSDFGANWSGINSGLPGGPVCNLFVTPDNSLLACVINGPNPTFNYRLRNGTWQVVNENGISFFQAQFASGWNGNIIEGSEYGIRNSSDNGLSFQTVTDFPDNISHDAILCIGNGPDSVLYAGSHDYGNFYSTDNGATWSTLGSTFGLAYAGQGYPGGNQSCIQVNQNNQAVFGCGQGGIYVHQGTLTDTTWVYASGYPSVWPLYPDPNATDNTVHDLMLFPDGTMFAHGNTIYMSTDGGLTWNPNNNGLPVGRINTPYVTGRYSLMTNTLAQASDGRVFVGSPAPGIGIYCTTSSVGGMTTSLLNSSSSNAVKVYPNPAKDFAIIELTCNEKENSVFTLFNSMGQNAEVANILLAPGKFKIERKNTSNGLYFFQIKNKKGVVVSGKLIFE